MARDVPVSDPAELSNCGFSSEFEAGREIRTQADLRRRELENLGRTVIDLIADAYPDWRNKGPSDHVWDEETFGERSNRGD